MGEGDTKSLSNIPSCGNTSVGFTLSPDTGNMRSISIKKAQVTDATAQLDIKRKMSEATRVLREQRALRVGAALSKASTETGLLHT